MKPFSRFILPCLLFVAALCLSTTRAEEAKRPNFLIIVADDLCWRDLGYEGNKQVKTPHLDQLRTQSMHLTGMFNPATTCSPTRHALYTGLYPVRSGAFPNHTKVYDGTKSVFTHLKDAGYRVALQNKEHVGPPASFPYQHIPGADDLTETKAFLSGDAAQPWFLVYASNDPHSPWNRGTPPVDPAKLSIPPYLHDNPQTRKQLANYYGEIGKLDSQVGALMDLLDETKQADNTLVVFVSEQGSSFPYGGKWSVYDNGIRTSTIARWPGKIAPGSTSRALMQYVDIAPTFLAAAGIDPEKIDTGCQDAEGKKGFDGRSFLPILTNGGDAFRTHVFAEATTLGVHGAKQPYPMRAVRDTRYKLILNLAPDNTYWIGGMHGAQPFTSWEKNAANKPDPALAARVRFLSHRPAEELYDLVTDPYETKDLSSSPDLTAVKATLRKELDTWMAQQGDKGMDTEKKAPSRLAKGKDD